MKECYKIKNGEIDDEQLDDLIENLEEIIQIYKDIFNVKFSKSASTLKQKVQEYNAKEIEGLYFVDPKQAKENTQIMIKQLKEKPCTIHFWWHQKPKGKDETINALKEKIEKDGYFYIYAIQEGKCVGKFKVEDFFVFDNPYIDKLPEDWKNCAKADIWFDINKRKKAIDDWIEKYGEKAGKPKVLFKITEVKELNTQTEKKGIKAQIIPFYEREIICSEPNCFTNSDLKLENFITNSFYNSLKTKGFVILAGLSGTGKTKIFEEFVKCFPKNNSLFFPIRPDFKDTKSLLGFYNPLKNHYHSTPLLDFVLEASKNYLEKGKNADPFFVLFDEMNLARVEYYFADFLSVLESKKFQDGDESLENNNFVEFVDFLGKELNEENHKFTSQSIKLHNEDTKDAPKELFLPPNLYFVGTVNIDETTHMFSPKVLDRAFTIEFDVGSFENYLEFLKENTGNTNSQIDENLKEDFVNDGNFAVVDKQKIKEFLEKEENKKHIDELEKINKTLRKYNLHFGYRVFDEIIMFLYNSQNSYLKFNDLNEAFDLAIKMKVLPKFHGTRQKLEKPILELLKQFEIENPEVKIEEGILQLNEINSDYKHTTHKLLEMLYKLKTQGFASFM